MGPYRKEMKSQDNCRPKPVFKDGKFAGGRDSFKGPVPQDMVFCHPKESTGFFDTVSISLLYKNGWQHFLFRFGSKQAFTDHIERYLPFFHMFLFLIVNQILFAS